MGFWKPAHLFGPMHAAGQAAMAGLEEGGTAAAVATLGAAAAGGGDGGRAGIKRRKKADRKHTIVDGKYVCNACQMPFTENGWRTHLRKIELGFSCDDAKLDQRTHGGERGARGVEQSARGIC